MHQTMPDLVALRDAALSANRHLGEADHYRIWCVTGDTDLNQFRRLEFDGWLVGGGEGLSGGNKHARARTEVTLFLTTDGRIITSVNLTPGAVIQMLGSAPDCWATFLGDNGSLQDVESWLESVHAYVGDDGMVMEASTAAVERARGLLDRMSRTTEREVEERHDREEVLIAARCRAISRS